ncbi:hypothetical protein [Streptomyces sp. NPDC015242]|uniref:hypothetical protein n=1 Tax=Streptomyces sp. NPDC015242 TaxID=3364951 RepID=UPI0037017AD4
MPMTCHFNGMDDLLREAFGRFTDRIVAVFDAHLMAPKRPRWRWPTFVARITATGGRSR